jgi:hypothetical protein
VKSDGVAKPKRKHKLSVFDHTGEFDLDATIEETQLNATEYTAPQPDQKWRARNVLSIHWNLIAEKYACPYPSFMSIMACIIDHSNPKTGRCDVGVWLVGRETGYTERWVRIVTAWIAANTPFLRIEARPGKTNAYHVQWTALEEIWRKIDKHLAAEKKAYRASSSGGVRNH